MSDQKTESYASTQSLETALALFDVIETDENIPQRGLARRLGVALGLTNALLKRCVRKGLLKARQAPARRYAYYMTPKGFREKSRLTTEYLSSSLGFYRNTRGQYLDAVDYCLKRNWKRIAVCGSSELSEIAIIAAQELDIHFTALISAERNQPSFLGVKVVRDLSEMDREVDAIIITDMNDPQAAFEKYAAIMSADRIVTPPLLHVMRSRKSDTRDG